MLEWMHDESVVRDLRTDFENKTIGDCESFIIAAETGSDNLHLAITDEYDEYLGTVSLKHIDKDNSAAEFGITIRKKAMHTGAARKAMKMLMDRAREHMELDTIYWCVDPSNHRALRFYDKNGYERVDILTKPNILNLIRREYSEEQIDMYVWYIQ